MWSICSVSALAGAAGGLALAWWLDPYPRGGSFTPLQTVPVLHYIAGRLGDRVTFYLCGIAAGLLTAGAVAWKVYPAMRDLPERTRR